MLARQRVQSVTGTRDGRRVRALNRTVHTSRSDRGRTPVFTHTKKPRAIPAAGDDDAIRLATDLETLSTEALGQLEVERAQGEAQRTHLEAILGLMGDAVLVMDARGRPLLTNRAYAELCGPDGVVLVDERGDPLPERETPQWRAAR